MFKTAKKSKDALSEVRLISCIKKLLSLFRKQCRQVLNLVPLSSPREESFIRRKKFVLVKKVSTQVFSFQFTYSFLFTRSRSIMQ